MAELTLDKAMQLANALHQLGRVIDAEKLYRQVLARQPSHAGALNMLGVIGGQVGQLDQGIQLISRAIAIKPGVAEYHNNLGELSRRNGQLDRAAAAYAEAMRLKPAYPEPHYNLGLMFCACDRLDEGIAEFREALRLRPGYAKAMNNLANALKDAGQIEQAVEYYKKTIAANPNDPAAWSNFLFALYYHPQYDDAMILREHLNWAETLARPLYSQIQPHHNDRSPERRLKIGYVSPDFCDHPAGRMILPLLANHNHQFFEIYCYSNVTQPDQTTTQTRTHADYWRDIRGVTDQELAAQIQTDGIDILVDLAAHTANNRLLVFARKPAPIQETWFPGTTGLKTIDYRLTDPHFDPPAHLQDPYTESSIHLRSFWCFQKRESPEVNRLPASAAGYITFACLNSFAKVNAPTLDLWVRVLQEVPNARLLMKAPAGAAVKNVSEIFQRGGISPDRIEFVGKKSLDEYFALYHRIDIGLDPAPFAGHTTTIDFIWMGVPLITLAGTTCIGRGGVSILSTVGLKEFIASDPAEYVDLAVKLAKNLPLLASYRATLRQRLIDSPLMDGPGYARDIENAFRDIWRKWCGASGQAKLDP